MQGGGQGGRNPAAACVQFSKKLDRMRHGGDPTYILTQSSTWSQSNQPSHSSSPTSSAINGTSASFFFFFFFFLPADRSSSSPHHPLLHPPGLLVRHQAYWSRHPTTGQGQLHARLLVLLCVKGRGGRNLPGRASMGAKLWCPPPKGVRRKSILLGTCTAVVSGYRSMAIRPYTCKYESNGHRPR